MKLIFCPVCSDVIRLFRELRACECGHASGYYLEDGLNAVISGSAVALGFNNSSFRGALDANELTLGPGMGIDFKAFVIPMPCPTITRLEADRKE